MGLGQVVSTAEGGEGRSELESMEAYMVLTEPYVLFTEVYMTLREPYMLVTYMSLRWRRRRRRTRTGARRRGCSRMRSSASATSARLSRSSPKVDFRRELMMRFQKWPNRGTHV